MDIITRLEEELAELVEAGKRNASKDKRRVMKIRALCDDLLADEEGAPASESLGEAADMSHEDIRNRLSQALKASLPPAPNQDYPWIRDVFDDHMVYEFGGKTWQCDYALGDRSVTLGVATEVVQKTMYEPVKAKAAESDDKDRPAGDALEESATVELERTIRLREGTKVGTDGTVPVVIIKAGWGNKRDNHYYPAKMLERDYRVFEGNKMYIDHPTPAEAKARPERSLKDLGGYITKVHGVVEGELLGTAKIVQPWLRELVEEAPEAVALSIRADGVVRKGTVGGRAGNIVESIPRSHSVDFVTQAGAGGRIASLYESARRGDEEMLETISDDELYEAAKGREGVLSKLRKEAKGEVQQLNEGEETPMSDDVKALQEAKAQADKDLAEARLELSKRDVRDAVASALSEAKLPEASKKRIRETLADKVYETDDARDAAIKATIESEAAYIKELGGPEIKGMGSTGVTESGKDTFKETLKNRFLSEGNSEEVAERMAEIAANGC